MIPTSEDLIRYLRRPTFAQMNTIYENFRIQCNLHKQVVTADQLEELFAQYEWTLEEWFNY